MSSNRLHGGNQLAALMGVLAVVAFVLIRSFLNPDPPPESEPRQTTQTNNVPASQAQQLTSSLRDRIKAQRQNQAEAAERRQIDDHLAEIERKRRENWEANFPFKPTYHPTLTYDPKRYDPSDPATFSTDPEMEMAVKRHGYMVGFFNNPQRFSAEFEQIHGLLDEIDRAENPEVMGEVFSHLRFYHQAKAFAPDTLLSRKQQRPYDPERDPADPLKRSVSEWIPLDGKTTWGDEANSYSNSIVGLLVSRKYWPNKDLLDADVARELRNRLLTEIPSENLVTMPPVVELPNGDIGAFGYLDPAEKALEPGDRLLTPFPSGDSN